MAMPTANPTLRSPRQKDVAEAMGISPALVSMVLNGRHDMWASAETRRRVRDTARAMGYVHKPRPQRSTRFFGVVSKDINAEIYRGVLRGLSSFTEAHDAMLGLATPTTDQQTERDLIREQIGKGSAGLVVIPFVPLRRDAAEGVDPYAEVPLPLVCVDLSPPFTERPRVLFDYLAAGEMLVDYFLREGRRRIAILRLSRWYHSVIEDRVRGYRMAMERHGVPADPSLVVDLDEGEGRPGWTLETAVERVADRLMEAKADAVIATFDPVAVMVAGALRRRGRRGPEDLRVAGFDDMEAGRLSTPPLTTVRQPWERMGEEAMRLLWDEVEGRDRRRAKVLLPVELVVRGT